MNEKEQFHCNQPEISKIPQKIKVRQDKASLGFYYDIHLEKQK